MLLGKEKSDNHSCIISAAVDTLFLKIEQNFKRSFLIISIAASLLYISLLGGKDVWSDEAYTFAMIEHSYADMWKITSADVHPPLYYFIVKTITAPFSYSLTSAKVVSIIPFILIITWGGIQLKRLFSVRTSIIFMIAFSLFPFLLPYAIEVRMYSWAAFFVFACGIYAYRCFEENSCSHWALYTISGVAAAYTHYFALVSVCIIYGLLLLMSIIRRKEIIKAWLISSIASLILYIPWLKSYIEQLVYMVNNDYWISEITPRTIYTYGLEVFGVRGFYGFAGIAVLTNIVVFICLIRESSKKKIVLSILALVIPVSTLLIGVIASILVRPVFIIRYLVPAIPFLVFSIALALGHIKNNKVLASALFVILFGGIYNYVEIIKDEYRVVSNPLDESFVKQYQDVDCYYVLTNTNHIASVLAHYERNIPIYRHIINPAGNPYRNRKDTDCFKIEENNTVVLMLDTGEKPSAHFENNYHIDYIGEINENGHLADVFLLQYNKDRKLQK